MYVESIHTIEYNRIVKFLKVKAPWDDPWPLGCVQMIFVVLAGICGFLYTIFLIFMVWGVLKKAALPHVIAARRLHYEVSREKKITLRLSKPLTVWF